MTGWLALRCQTHFLQATAAAPVLFRLLRLEHQSRKDNYNFWCFRPTKTHKNWALALALGFLDQWCGHGQLVGTFRLGKQFGEPEARVMLVGSHLISRLTSQNNIIKKKM